MKSGTFLKLVVWGMTLGASSSVYADPNAITDLSKSDVDRIQVDRPAAPTVDDLKKSGFVSASFLSPEVRSRLDTDECRDYLFNLDCERFHCSAAHRPVADEAKCAAIKARAEKEDPAKFGMGRNVKLSPDLDDIESGNDVKALRKKVKELEAKNRALEKKNKALRSMASQSCSSPDHTEAKVKQSLGLTPSAQTGERQDSDGVSQPTDVSLAK